MDYFTHPSLSRGLITYIGNKRSLLPFISQGIDRIEAETGPVRTMADPFAGSGVVGRLGRLRGATVASGDMEEYTRPFGRSFLEVLPEEVEELFSPTGGYRPTLDYLNSLQGPDREEDALFSRHYAPRSTEEADPNRERLFYTRENGLRIDAVLAAIHRDLPLSPLARDVLLASLLVEMSVHNNTSGVMKGFHHGWGGRGGDALSRIMAPIELEVLPFITGPRGHTWVGPAEEFFPAMEAAGFGPFDLVYADPPYNIHQYGANYHLLTTAVRWDFYDPGPVRPGARAGIRTDHYRSDFCSTRGNRARDAFARFLEAARCRNLLVSYNNDGIIDARTMVDLLGEDGINTVQLLSREHHKFRGGKATQSALKTDEYLFVVHRGVRQSRRDREKLYGDVERMTLHRQLHDRFLLPSHWTALGGTADKGRRSGNPVGAPWTLATPGGSRIVLSPELRVLNVTRTDHDVPTDHGVPTGDHKLTRMAENASGTVVQAVEELVLQNELETAVFLLQRLKIRKYRTDFLRLAALIAQAEPDSATRRRLEELTTRVTGNTGTGNSVTGDIDPAGPPRSPR